VRSMCGGMFSFSSLLYPQFAYFFNILVTITSSNTYIRECVKIPDVSLRGRKCQVGWVGHV